MLLHHFVNAGVLVQSRSRATVTNTAKWGYEAKDKDPTRGCENIRVTSKTEVDVQMCLIERKSKST